MGIWKWHKFGSRRSQLHYKLPVDNTEQFGYEKSVLFVFMSTSDSFWLQFLFSLNDSCVKTWKHVYCATIHSMYTHYLSTSKRYHNYSVPLFMKLACYSTSKVKNIFIHPWLYSPLPDLGRFFSFIILYTVGRNPWTGDQPIARSLPTHRTA
jgi:hypothetical protein